ncbi:MAG: adenosylmethionine--8-amino-7-oxononanoate transaminase [Gammaproteobacteria bacterium RIFCSPHIGHO2_12_FULL_41_20]|nr:MAG: adenosylmethionine--8-amino-7-oxononanoate transaminase [Gammaproteobacteria bacterium RIFCSPHIGHO2_12_FULL_41_20]
MGIDTEETNLSGIRYSLSKRDSRVIWHPFTQHQIAPLPIPIVRGEGAYLFDIQGKRYLDLISSWWVNLYGHAHPEIARAIYQQAQRLEQVIFAGFTHEPAVELAETLLTILPPKFGKIFYSDNGSTAVEVALKMAYQYWRNQGELQRRRFIAFQGGYHGDTFGAMAVGKSSKFFDHFADCFFSVDFSPYPMTWWDDATIVQKEQAALTWLSDYLSCHASEIAALIIEPLVQGATGMRMCRPQFLQELECLAQRYQLLVIYDEVMTGFGRTGEFFACQKAKTFPDIICLAKGLTGGFLPLAVTVCREFIYQAFLREDFQGALAHSHSFTANPLGCAAGLASMRLLQDNYTSQQLKMIETVHQESLWQLVTRGLIEKPRYCGTIAAFALSQSIDYGSLHSQHWQSRFMEQGLLVRPLGNVIYLMPPYCIREEDLRAAYATIETVIKRG